MRLSDEFGLKHIMRAFRWRIGVTWTLVLLETALLALVPLLIGLAIDGLFAGRMDELLLMTGVLVALVVAGVTRRIYDTRAYGSIRVELGSALDRRFPDMPVSSKTARLDMSRELVDFLEEEVPLLLTAIIQIATSLVILSLFHQYLALSALAVTVGMMALYSLFHRRFYRLNAAFNEQTEQQVRTLEKGGARNLFRHLRALRDHEVRLSDTEAVVYGMIFLLQIGFIVFNLWFATQIPGVTVGTIFSIVAYSWEYVEAAIMLPAALQSWSRLDEITRRLNGGPAASKQE